MPSKSRTIPPFLVGLEHHPAGPNWREALVEEFGEAFIIKNEQDFEKAALYLDAYPDTSGLMIVQSEGAGKQTWCSLPITEEKITDMDSAKRIFKEYTAEADEKETPPDFYREYNEGKFFIAVALLA